MVMVMQEISLREINQHFSRYMQAVEKGEEIIITRRGKPIAKLVAVAASRKLSDEQVSARKRLRKRMKKGFHLGGESFDREDLHERSTNHC